MRILQALFFLLIVRPLISLILGLNIHGRDNLPVREPAIIAPNHNSHLDTLVLMSLFPLFRLNHVRPVAAADFFLANRVLAWLSLNIIRIIPIDRLGTQLNSDPLAQMSAVLDEGDTLLIFPEGSRGQPEQLSRFKSGIARLAQLHPEVPIVPVYTHGLGKALPRGDLLIVPFFADVIFGEPIYWQGSVGATMQAYEQAMAALAARLNIPEWE